ncbi:MAG: LAGLIDADG endonuclease [bacterium]|nr:LAGLIDADG endonuclease [bacterium]
MDNTVGSRRVLSPKQQSILIGLLLGDGHMEYRYTYPRLRITHSLKQKDYVNWLYSQFKEFCTQEPHEMKRVDSRTNNTYYWYLFSTRTTSAFLEYYRMFYPKGKKVVPKNIEQLLSSKLSLGIWYMDDGFKRSDCDSLYLCTSGFTLEEQIFLQGILQKKYGLETKIHFAGKNARIYFPVKSARRFCELIKPYLLPMFNYKLL